MADLSTGRGPLAGVRVLEFAGLGPAPFAGMLLADMGADVVRIERPEYRARPHDIVLRGRRTIQLDLKNLVARRAVEKLAGRADVLIEGYRPGVMERLGLGPDVVLQTNARLVYGRMSGWGQDGPLAMTPGHDVNFIALAGALDSIGPENGDPTLPLNLVGDYGGGALYLVAGVLAALFVAKSSGKGQVVDCAACDGVLSLMTQFHGMLARSEWRGRGASQFGGGAHFYGAYRCADGKFLAVAAGEPAFYVTLRRCLGLDDPLFDNPRDQALWPVLKEKMQAIFAAKPRGDWLDIFSGEEACVTPVNTIGESLNDPHLRARGSVVDIDGVAQAGAVPRFSRTPGAPGGRPAAAFLDDVLADWRDDR